MSLSRRIMESVLQRQMEHSRSTDRASSFHASAMGGHRCDLRVWFERMRPGERATYSAETAVRMEDGTAGEEITRRWIKDAGIEIEPIRRGKSNTSSWERYELTGAIDGWLPEQQAILEHKCVSEFAFAKWDTQEDVIGDVPWGERYACQIAIYMLLNGVDRAILLLRHRGWLKDIPMALDDAMLELAEDALQRIERVQAHLKAGTEPAPREWSAKVCGTCSYLGICPVERPSLTGEVLDDPEVAELLEVRHGAEKAHSDFGKADRVAKARLKEIAGATPFDLAICGDFEIRRTTSERKPFTSAGGTTTTFKIKRLGEQEAEED